MLLPDMGGKDIQQIQTRDKLAKMFLFVQTGTDIGSFVCDLHRKVTCVQNSNKECQKVDQVQGRQLAKLKSGLSFYKLIQFCQFDKNAANCDRWPTSQASLYI